MSAIAGILHLDGRPADGSALDGMLDAMAHRGPDGRGTWREGALALGHLLLHTTRASLREEHPLAAPDGLVLAADARVDNRAELMADLHLPPPPRDDTCDAALVLGAHRTWGRAAPEHVLGDFAWACWDGARRRLTCARDPMGVKPLYYCYRPGRLFAFASEIRALLSLEEVPAHLNEERVADYLLRTFDRRSTFYRGIERLPAAHVLTLSPAEGLRLHGYWRLDPEAPEPASDAEHVEGFRAVFDEAVRCRTRSAFAVGSALSGGLDSSSIAVVARDQLLEEDRGPLPTFSGVFPGLPARALALIVERAYVDAVLATGGSAAHKIRADRLSPFFDGERMARHMEDAFRVPNLYLHWALYGAAQEQGVRVFLDGIDGDSAVSHGLERLSALARQERWALLRDEIDALARRGVSSRAFYLWRQVFPQLTALARRGRWLRFARAARALHRHFGEAPGPLLKTYWLLPFVPAPARRAWRTWRGHPMEEPLIRSGFARRSSAWERRHASQRRSEAAAPTAREAHRRGLLAPLFQQTLEMADKASAAFGLEARYPFFDRRLLEYCVALPAEQKLRGGWTRLVLRRALDGRLPPTVARRARKSSLAPNYALRLLHDERAALEHVLFNDESAVARYADMDAARAAFRRYAADPVRRPDDAFTVYSVVMLERWLQREGFG